MLAAEDLVLRSAEVVPLLAIRVTAQASHPATEHRRRLEPQLLAVDADVQAVLLGEKMLLRPCWWQKKIKLLRSRSLRRRIRTKHRYSPNYTGVSSDAVQAKAADGRKNQVTLSKRRFRVVYSDLRRDTEEEQKTDGATG